MVVLERCGGQSQRWIVTLVEWHASGARKDMAEQARAGIVGACALASCCLSVGMHLIDSA
jgi:hypothetical protein